jgi:hypothetical protein
VLTLAEEMGFPTSVVVEEKPADYSLYEGIEQYQVESR